MALMNVNNEFRVGASNADILDAISDIRAESRVMNNALRQGAQELHEVKAEMRGLQHKYRDLKIECNQSKKALIQRDASDAIKSCKSTITAIKASRVGLVSLGAAGLVVPLALLATPLAPAVLAGSFIGGGTATSGFLIASSQINDKLKSKKNDLWVLEKFPESVSSTEIKEKAYALLKNLDDLIKEHKGYLSECSDGATTHEEEIQYKRFEEKVAGFKAQLNDQAEVLRLEIQENFYA